MDADSRLFLLSVICVPAACGEGNPGATLNGSGAIPDDDDGSYFEPTGGGGPGGGGGAVGGSGCTALNTAYASCYTNEPYVPPATGGIATGGMGSSGGVEGGTDGNDGGGYQPPGFATYCAELFAYYAAAFGEPCAAAIDEVYACMAPFACQELGEQGVDGICAGQIARADSICPEVSEGGEIPETTGAGSTG